MYDIDIYDYLQRRAMEFKEDIHKNKKVKNASPKALYVGIGKRLRMLRFELDYTQEQMAETLEMSLAYYGKVESIMVS